METGEDARDVGEHYGTVDQDVATYFLHRNARMVGVGTDDRGLTVYEFEVSASQAMLLVQEFAGSEAQRLLTLHEHVRQMALKRRRQRG